MMKMSGSRWLRVAGAVALTAAAVVPLTLPTAAQAWWARGGWGPGIYVGIPAPVVVVPPPVMYAPPVAYAAPPVVYARPVWFAGHWAGGYWVPGHWR
jgi:hypothetical protein